MKNANYRQKSKDLIKISDLRNFYINLRKYEITKTAQLLGTIPWVSHTFFVKFRLYATALHKEDLVYRAKIFRESELENEGHLLMKQ